MKFNKNNFSNQFHGRHHHSQHKHHHKQYKYQKKNQNINKSFKPIKIALAGNPNVGKSVIFNQLTGLSQVIGNWPGKTVCKAEGRTIFCGYLFNIIDLPGIYSLSTYSLEEIISREYIVEEKPDYIISVIDSNHLERNLFFTLQLIMLGRPVIISLNQYDLLEKRGFSIDTLKLSELLGVPVIPTIAVHNRGVHELLEKIIELQEKKIPYSPEKIIFGREVETRLIKIAENFKEIFPNHNYTSQFAALKLIENDEEFISSFSFKQENELQLLESAQKTKNELEEIHGEQISTILNAELFNIANKISRSVETVQKPTSKQKIDNLIDHLTIHSIFGYLILALILFGGYTMIFNFGDWFSGIIDSLVEMWTPGASTILGGKDSLLFKIIWNGLFNGLMGGLGGVLPFVFAFFIFIEIMQDVGYLPRAAYLMDRFLQRLGVHGKTIIPILLGFGCNVPAISAASIMETEKEKRRAILIGSMIPCSAVATIVMGLVGKYLGIEYAWLLYLVSFTSIIIVGRILANLDVAVESELIIELHDFRKPNFKVILKQTWNRCKEFVYLALPLIVIISGLMEILMQFDLLNPVNTFLSPITVGLLGLPIGIGVYFLYGILRKELNLVLLELFVTVSLGSSMLEYLSPIQMIVFCVITMIYIPCVAVIVTIKKESSIHYAILISVLEVLLAVVIAGAIRWINVLILLIIPDIADLVGITITFIIFFILVGIFLLILPNMMDIHNKQELTAIKPNLIPSSDCYGKSCNSSDMCKNCGYKR